MSFFKKKTDLFVVGPEVPKEEEVKELDYSREIAFLLEQEAKEKGNVKD